MEYRWLKNKLTSKDLPKLLYVYLGDRDNDISKLNVIWKEVIRIEVIWNHGIIVGDQKYIQWNDKLCVYANNEKTKFIRLAEFSSDDSATKMRVIKDKTEIKIYQVKDIKSKEFSTDDYVINYPKLNSQCNSFGDLHSFDHKVEKIDDIVYTADELEYELSKMKDRLISLKVYNSEGILIIPPFIDDSLKALELLKGDGNIDPINNMNASSIIIQISRKLSQMTDINPIMQTIGEQLADYYTTGPCSQGRVIRLYQILRSL